MAASVDFQALSKQLQVLQAQLQNAMRTGDKPHDRSMADAIVLPGACPPGLKACDPDEEAKYGRTCPDVRVYAPDPLIADSEGRICYAPSDLVKWAGTKAASGDIDTLLEHASARLLDALSNTKVLDNVKRMLLESNIVNATNPRLFGANACATPQGNHCSTWSPTLVKDMNVDDIDAGLAEATAMYSASSTDAPNVWNDNTLMGWVQSVAKSVTSIVGLGRGGSEYVFHSWSKPWSTTTDSSTRKVGTVDNAYSTAINPATLAYAGAYAWAKSADAMANRLGGEYEAKYLDRVKRLVSIIMRANVAITLKGFTTKYPSLANLTFDVAWPMIIESTIGLKGLLRAAEEVTTLDGITNDQLSNLDPRAQWDLVVKQYKKYNRF